jgi:hypothetical protein
MNIPTLVSFILDSSGSMQSVRSATIEGFNAFVQEQGAVPGEIRCTLTLFDTAFETPFIGHDLRALPALGSEANPYIPGGMTALFDAVGDTIKSTETWISENGFAGKVVVVILTDGEENSSRRWHVVHPLRDGDDADVAGLIAYKQREGWDFAFLGSGGSEWLERTFGHVATADQFTGYEHGAVATAGTYSSVSRGLTQSRVSGQSFRVPNS